MDESQGPVETPARAGRRPVRGALKVEPEDFLVDEIPLYEACGSGEHLYVRIEKRSMTTGRAARLLADALGVRPASIGWAGLKDRRAICTQYLSAPWNERAAEFEPGALAEGLRVVSVGRHTNKLRRGHLAGNRFDLRVRSLEWGEGGVERARRSIEESARAIERLGFPNYFGPQRFGRDGSTLAHGMAMWRAQGRGPRDRALRRLALNAAQADLFNEALAARLRSGSLDRVEAGDVMVKRGRGGPFLVEASAASVAEAQARYDAHEIAITGPLFGPKMPRAQGAPGDREEAILAERGLEAGELARFGKLARGGRRAYTARAPELSWVLDEAERELRISFVLGPGSYATVLIAELIEDDARERVGG